jgi:hypothetical protein
MRLPSSITLGQVCRSPLILLAFLFLVVIAIYESSDFILSCDAVSLIFLFKMFLDHAFFKKQPQDPLAGSRAHLSPQIRLFDHAAQAGGEARGVARRKFQSGLADDFCESADLRDADDAPTPHLRHRGEPGRLFHQRRRHHGNHLFKCCAQRIPAQEAGENDMITEAARIGQRLQPRPFRAFAGKFQF